MKYSGLSRQKGLALLAMLSIFIAVFTAAVIARFSINKLQFIKQQRQMVVLLDVKDAILGYALQQEFIGQLPCPDFDGDGTEDRLGSNTCRTQLGFVPYVTLNLDELLDSSLARLWLAVELSYALPTVNPTEVSSVTVDGSTDVAAVILAPGVAFPSQTRGNNDSATVFTRYFEGINGNTNKAEYAHELSDTSNDELIFIDVIEYWKIMCKVRSDC